MKVLVLLLLLRVCCLSVLAERKSYEGYKVLSVAIKNEVDMNLLTYIQDTDLVDFWTDIHVGAPLHINVPPHVLDTVTELLVDTGIEYNVHIEDLQRLISEEVEHLKEKRDFDRNEYNTYEEIMDEMELMAARCPTNVDNLHCDTVVIGQSCEGLDIKMLRIRKLNNGEDDPNRQAIWIDSLIHAREWIAGSTLVNIAYALTDDYDDDPDVQRLVDDYDFYLVPVMNPDGYSYTMDFDRMWRKSRCTNPGSSCLGVDLNRNYDHAWGTDGISTNPCSDVYCGPSAASDPGTEAVQTEASQLSHKLVAFISLHSYMQSWLFPFANTVDGSNCNVASNYDDLLRAGEAAAQATGDTHGTQWTSRQICVNGGSSGSGLTQDYMRGIANIPYVYTPELRGNSFILPPEHIPLSYEEVWNGLLALIDSIEES